MFKNKVILITGAANGIGKKLVECYIEKGATVIAADIDHENGIKLVKQFGEHCIFIETDLRQEKDILDLFKTIREHYTKLDILINNAGKMKTIDLFEHSSLDWDDIMHTNVRSVFLCSREAAKIMRNQSFGAIINIASTRAMMSEPNCESYAASKGAILSLTHSLASSLSAYPITVNSISPGWIETGDYSKLSSTDHSQHFSGRVGTPEDIVRACMFLSNPQNNFINGTNLTIDGGMTKKMIYQQ